ncbi:transcription factor IIA, alpha/beta subunit [Cercophora newfieldiana]|uniref:Transcription initiation factor IIA large subunit n=1 Tax=Cercophora newfieldiana TaxID=92897 RepID=A0AA39YS23_9PEZI|nr:transcription factor IIA, alpha/beta subunit [Cercophora newfieldiana]
MSNNHVGAVYDHIIQEVINAVRVDFEENGVDDGILEELKKGWQHKLSQLGVAQFPWDPKPEPVPAAAPPQPANAAPVNNTAQQAQQQAAAYTQSTLSPQTSVQPLSHPGNSQQNGNGIGIKNEPGLKNDPAIKQEPGSGGQGMIYNNSAAPRAQTVAAHRAAQALESRYGTHAAASINALQNSIPPQRQGQPMPQQQQQQMQHQMQQMQQQQQMNTQQYRQGMVNNMQQQQQRMQQQQANGTAPNGLPSAQVDGPSDGFEGVLMQRGPDGRPVEMGRVEIDNILHAQMLARAKEMQGGGLMLPLREATRHRGVAKKAVAGPSQMDGPDDDFKNEDLDDDAINSDLDDPDDEKDDDEDDEDSMSHMMLCMYDKVQRVKNKWKCTLKDGVLTVNNKEYVFHKATGEYEW